MKSYEILPTGAIAGGAASGSGTKSTGCGCKGAGCGSQGGGCGSTGGGMDGAKPGRQFLGRKLKEWEIVPDRKLAPQIITMVSPQPTLVFPPPFRGPQLLGPYTSPSLWRPDAPHVHDSLIHWTHFPRLGCSNIRSRCEHLRAREDASEVNAILWRHRLARILDLIRRSVSCVSLDCDDIFEMMRLNTYLRTDLANAWSRDLGNRDLRLVLDDLNEDHTKLHFAYIDCADNRPLSTVCDVITGDTLHTRRWAESLAQFYEDESARFRGEIARLNEFRRQYFPGCAPC